MADDPQASPGPKWLRWRMSNWLALILWMIIIALSFVGFMRLFAWDRFSLFAMLNTITIALYLVAWPIAIAAGIGRRPVLATAALLICVLQVLLLAPEFTATEALPPWTHHAYSFRLLDGNVYDENPSMKGYIEQIKTMDPDLVTFQEAVPSDVKQLRRSEVLASLTHQYEVVATDPFAFFIACRFPLVGTHVISMFGNALIVETTMELPTGPQPLWVVHTIAPLSVSFDEWRSQLATIARSVREHGTSRLIVVGDFNATWGSKGFRNILSTGLSDAAAARGRALQMTWSQMMPPLPPFARIDHILTGPGVEVTQYSTHEGSGSDHRDLVATVAVRR